VLRTRTTRIIRSQDRGRLAHYGGRVRRDSRDGTAFPGVNARRVEHRLGERELHSHGLSVRDGHRLRLVVAFIDALVNTVIDAVVHAKQQPFFQPVIIDVGAGILE
jgi:hypothetical protein